MFFAILDFTDFFVIFMVVAITSGGGVASAYLRPGNDGRRLRDIEHKLNLVMAHLGIENVPPPGTAWQERADSGDKIGAIKAYREDHGVGLADAKKAVEAYMDA
jgi:hypothetical protein